MIGGVATGFVATGFVATGSVAAGAVATGSVAAGAVATGCVAGGSVVVGAVATGRGVGGAGVDGRDATGCDADRAGVSEVATGSVALQCVVEEADATRLITLQRVAPGGAAGLVTSGCVEPAPVVGALGGTVAPGDGLAGGPGGADGTAPPAPLGGNGLAVGGAPALTGAAVGVACGSDWPGAAEPLVVTPVAELDNPSGASPVVMPNPFEDRLGPVGVMRP